MSVPLSRWWCGNGRRQRLRHPLRCRTSRCSTRTDQAGVPDLVVIDDKPKKLLVGEGGGLPVPAVALGGDQAVMRPLDLTTVYATFAAGGVRHKTHFVTRVSGEDGKVLYQATENASSAFHPDRAQSKAIHRPHGDHRSGRRREGVATGGGRRPVPDHLAEVR